MFTDSITQLALGYQVADTLCAAPAAAQAKPRLAAGLSGRTEPARLAVGENVMVVGAANSDGSVTAQTIQLRPPMAAGPNGPGRDQQPGEQPPAPPSPTDQ